MRDAQSGFDLVTQPWIPVLDQDGVVHERSILQALTDAPSGVEILGEVPTQSFAILRLLLAILHRALRDETFDISGPGSLQEWAEARQLWPDIVAGVDGYLAEYRERFDLFHPETPFFQVAGLRTAKHEVSGLEKLIVDVPNGAPFFTTRIRRGVERISAAEAARWLVHVHAFDPSGIRSGAVGDGRVKGGKGYPIGPGWAGQLGGVHLVGPTLLDTLLLNLIVPSAVKQAPAVHDLPPWERPPLGAGVQERPPDQAMPSGPVDLYTWQTRRVRLEGGPDGVTALVLANGDPMTPQNRHLVEPMSSWRHSEPQSKKFGQPTYMPQLHDSGRVVWRGLKSLLAAAVVPRSGDGQPARWLKPDIVRWAEVIAPLLREDGIAPVRVRAVGLVYGSNNSVVDELIDDRLELPLALLEDDTGQLAQLAVDAVDATERAVLVLRDLAARLAQAAGADPKTVDGPRDRAAERAYADLDAPFRTWLASLTREIPLEEAAGRWRVTARQILHSAGRELVDTASPCAWVGRIVKNLGGKAALLDAGLAWRWFGAGLDRVLPNGSRTSEAVLS